MINDHYWILNVKNEEEEIIIVVFIHTGKFNV